MAIAFRSDITHQIPVDDGSATVAGVISGDTDIDTSLGSAYGGGVLDFSSRVASGFVFWVAGSETTIDVNVQSSNRQALVLQCWTGVDVTGGGALDNPTGGNTGGGYSLADGATGLPNCASLTTLNANSIVFAGGSLDDDNMSAVTAPTGYSNLSWRAAGGAAGTTSTAMLASMIKASAGAEDPAAFTGTGGNDEWDAITISFKAAAANGGLFRPSPMNGISGGGPFFADPLACMIFVPRRQLIVPRRR